MEALWFWLVTFALTVYVILDGYALGAGILHLFVARADRERAQVIRTIGPTWGGNEVWLLATGGTLFAVFPGLYSTAFSGFYLPLMIVLWLVIGRAAGIEFRHEAGGPLWTPLWDAAFSVSSAALALMFGVALGNVARGVPIAPDGTFFEPLWTDFSSRRATGILDGFTILCGLTTLAALAQHGGLWVAAKTDGVLRNRARRAAGAAGGAAALLTVAITAWTWSLQPRMAARFSEHPGGYLLPACALLGLMAAQGFRRFGRDRAAFAGSALYLAGMMASVAFSLFPYVLPSSLDPERGLTAAAAAADGTTLRTALAWWIPGMALAVGYLIVVHWVFAGKGGASEDPY